MIGQGPAEHGADRGESGVAGSGVVATSLFEVVEEPGDVRCGDDVEVGGGGGNPECGGQVLEKHPPGVAVGTDRVGRQVTLGMGEGREVGLQTNGQGVHSISLSEMGSSLPAARAMSSPVAVC